MTVKFAGLELKNPFLASSGCWGYGWEGEEYFPGLGWGAVISKTITVEKREGNRPPRIFELENAVINRIGLQNCGLDAFIENELPKTRYLPYPVIMSIFGNNTAEWIKLVTVLSAEDVTAFELNLSCPNIKGEKMVENIPECLKTAEILKGLTEKPIIAKINALDNPAVLSRDLEKAGIDGIVCSNTLPAAFYHEKTFYEGGLSGPAIKPVVLKAILNIRRMTGIDIAACGGIVSLDDIEEYRQSGANAFMLGSILLSQPEILREINPFFAIGMKNRDGKDII
ncbi:MAG: HisA/HisF-related TIM barrel protein [Elusimicrobiota bacterium]